jgi:hypothetical protein
MAPSLKHPHAGADLQLSEEIGIVPAYSALND